MEERACEKKREIEGRDCTWAPTLKTTSRKTAKFRKSTVQQLVIIALLGAGGFCCQFDEPDPIWIGAVGLPALLVWSEHPAVSYSTRLHYVCPLRALILPLHKPCKTASASYASTHPGARLVSGTTLLVSPTDNPKLTANRTKDKRPHGVKGLQQVRTCFGHERQR
jgi:hypothetical protein